MAYAGNRAGDDYTINGPPIDSVVSNNIICENESVYLGSGIHLDAASYLSLINNTICNNGPSYGSGIYLVNNSSPDTFNNIVWGNNTSVSTWQFFPDAGCNPSVSFSNIEGDWTGPGSDNLFGDSHDDPLLDQVCHLTVKSPCINRGTITGAPADDYDGNVRPYMGTVDIGADEFVDTHTLEADGFTISEQTGGTINFSLTAGTSNAGRDYIILGSLSGTNPGIPMPRINIPINWDAFTSGLIIVAPVIPGFLWKLDPSGNSTATLPAPPLTKF